MVLMWIIAGMIAAAVAGFAVTSFAGGSTPTPSQSSAGLTSSAAASTAGGRGAPGLSGSASASQSASSSACAATSSSQSQGASQSASACASAQILVAVGVPERPILARLPVSVPDFGLGYIRVPDTDADANHIGAGPAEHIHVFGTCDFGTASIHANEHSIIRIDIRST